MVQGQPTIVTPAVDSTAKGATASAAGTVPSTSPVPITTSGAAVASKPADSKGQIAPVTAGGSNAPTPSTTAPVNQPVTPTSTTNNNNTTPSKQPAPTAQQPVTATATTKMDVPTATNAVNKGQTVSTTAGGANAPTPSSAVAQPVTPSKPQLTPLTSVATTATAGAGAGAGAGASIVVGGTDKAVVGSTAPTGAKIAR